ncbi:MAG: DUF5916 domain-containing protein [Vicinamibacterales bacterium]
MRWLTILFLGLGVGRVAAQDAQDGVVEPSPPATYSRASDGRITLRAIRLAEPLTLDGVLEEAVYRENTPASDFIQQEPREGQPATERTEAWVLFDREHLYIAARCYDSQPERMVVNEMRRDSQTIFNNENFTVSIDPFYDRRSGFFFQTNPLGAIRDQEVGSERENNNDWNTVWDARAARNARGWTLEMVIPFRSLRYERGGPQTWGIHLRRSIRWKHEQVFIAPVPASSGVRGIYRFSDAATLVGLEAPPQARNLEIKPYGISSLTTNRAAPAPFSNQLGGDAGVDVKYGLTKGLTLDATYNTDFAQVEDDEQQVNLTRFSLFFPEKREFFLEGQGIFAFGQQSSASGGGGGGGGGIRSSATNLSPVLFFSRRIGLSGTQEVPIVAGARVTGRAGPFAVGALNIQTAESDTAGAASTNFTVVRVRRDLLRRSTIGLIATRRDPAFGGGTNGAAGVDASFAFFQNLNVRGFWARTSTPGPGATSGDSYRAELDYAGDRYGLQAEHLTVGRDFNPEVGFLRREDFRRHAVLARFSPRPATRFRRVRKFSYEASYDYITSPDGELETREVQGTFKTELHTSDVATVEYTRSFEWTPTAFSISGIPIAPGAYHFQDVRSTYQLGNQHRVSGTLTLARGSFWGGRKTEIGYRGRAELSYRFYLEPGITVNVLDLPAGSVTAKLVSTRATYTFSPRVFTSALVQYNSSSRSLSGNYRFRWEYQPGSDLFVVYSDGRDTSTRGYPELVNRTFVVKATRLFRF